MQQLQSISSRNDLKRDAFYLFMLAPNSVSDIVHQLLSLKQSFLKAFRATQKALE